MNKIYKLAEKLNTVKQNGGVINIEETDVIQSIHQAYEFQDIVVEISNMIRCGWKVGATSYNAQKELMNERISLYINNITPNTDFFTYSHFLSL